MANHKVAVQKLADHIETDYLRLGYSIGRQTNASLEILCPPEVDNADFLFEDIRTNFDSPSCSVSYLGSNITVNVQFDRQGTHIIHTGMGVTDALAVLVKSVGGLVPSVPTVGKVVAVMSIILAVQYREILAREIEWRAANMDATTDV